jgi:hypothetical protein
MNKCSLVRVRLNQGGYDSKGRYFGIDRPLYHYSFEDYYQEWKEDYIRANNRGHAITILTKKFPGLKFFRY